MSTLSSYDRMTLPKMMAISDTISGVKQMTSTEKVLHCARDDNLVFHLCLIGNQWHARVHGKRFAASSSGGIACK